MIQYAREVTEFGYVFKQVHCMPTASY